MKVRPFQSLFLLLALPLCIWSCDSRPTASPEGVSKAFFDAFGQEDYDLAKQYGTPKTAKALDKILASSKDAKPEAPLGAFDVLSCKTYDHESTCHLCCNDDDEEISVKVLHKGDQWLVSMSELDFSRNFNFLTESPESVVKGFLVAMDQGDYTAAEAFASVETKKVLETMKQMNSMGGGNTPSGIEDYRVSCDLNGMSGNCSVCCNQEGDETEVKVIKEGGRWVVSMGKEEMNKENGGGGSFSSSFGDDNPELTVEKYLSALHAKDYEAAKRYADKSTRDALGALSQMEDDGNSPAPRPFQAKCNTFGNEGDCKACCDEDGDDIPVSIVRESGKWVVKMSKEEMQGDRSGGGGVQ